MQCDQITNSFHLNNSKATLLLRRITSNRYDQNFSPRLKAGKKIEDSETIEKHIGRNANKQRLTKIQFQILFLSSHAIID